MAMSSSTAVVRMPGARRWRPWPPDFTPNSPVSGCPGTGCSHAVYLWTLEGHHAGARNSCKVSGWEEWDLDATMKVTRSLGWFDAAEDQRRIDGT
jgi:hypothetical protein